MGSEVTQPCIQDDALQAMGVPPMIQCLPHERHQRRRAPSTQAMRAYGLMPVAARRAQAQCARRVHAHVRCMNCTTDNLRNWGLDRITTFADSDWSESFKHCVWKNSGVHLRPVNGQPSSDCCTSETGHSKGWDRSRPAHDRLVTQRFRCEVKHMASSR